MLQTPNLASMFPVTVHTWPLKIFRKGSVTKVMWCPHFWLLNANSSKMDKTTWPESFWPRNTVGKRHCVRTCIISDFRWQRAKLFHKYDRGITQCCKFPPTTITCLLKIWHWLDSSPNFRRIVTSRYDKNRVTLNTHRTIGLTGYIGPLILTLVHKPDSPIIRYPTVRYSQLVLSNALLSVTAKTGYHHSAWSRYYLAVSHPYQIACKVILAGTSSSKGTCQSAV